jgi:hypothetical protein
MRPIVEQTAQQFYGGGELPVAPFEYQPGPAIPRNEGETDEEYAARMQAFEEADRRTQFESYQRNVAEQQAQAQQLGDVRDIGAQGNLGMAEATLQAAEATGAAGVEQAKEVAQLQAQTAESTAQAIEASRQADLERRQFAQDQLDAVQESRKLQDATRKKLEALPDLDPGRFWKSKSGAGKLAAIFGAIAGGAIGSTAVPDQIERQSMQDLEAQKANAAQTLDLAAEADRQVQQQVSIYGELLDAAGSERAADAMYLQLQLEDAARQLEAKIAETTVPGLQAQLQESLVGLRGKLDQQQRIIDTEMATTPRSILSRRGGIPRRERERLEKRLDQLFDEGFELTKLGITSEEKALDRAGKLEAEMAKAKGTEQKGARQLAAQHAKDTAKLRGATENLRAMQKKWRAGNIGGRGLDAYFLTEEGRGVREDINEAIRKQLYAESGANAPPAEIESRMESMLAGWGDNELMANVDRIVRANQRQILEGEYGIGEDARRMLYNNPDLEPLPARGAVGTVAEGAAADAAALGGRVVQ